MKSSFDERSTFNSEKSTSELHHSNSVSFLNTAVQNHRNGRYEEALNNYKKAIQINPKNSGAFYNIGIIYKQMKKYQKSILYFQRAVELKPDYIEAYTNLGNVCKKIKQYAFSQNYYLKAVELDKKNNGVLNNLGLLYISLQKYDEGEHIFKKMLQNNPMSQIAFNSLGVIKKNRKDFNQAIKNWEKAIKCNENFAQPYYNIALLKISQNKSQQAEVYLKKSQQLKTDNLLVLSVRAINLHKINRSQQAFQLLDKVNKLINQASIQQLESKTKIKKRTLLWIKSTVSQLKRVENLNGHRQSMTALQQKQLKQLNDKYFNSLIQADQKQQNSKLQQINKKIRELQNQIKLQNTKIQKIQEDVSAIKIDVEKIKKQFQWDQRFDKLLQQEPENANYYRCLYSVICASVQAYRAVKTGIVTAGEGIIKSKVGGFIEKLVKILKLGESLPTISSFCSILSKIGEVYLGKQSEHVCNQIIGATSCLYNEKKLTKATSQMIIYLSKQPIYKKLLTKGKDEGKTKDKVWYQKVIEGLTSAKQKIETKQKQFLTKVSQFGGHDVTEQMNAAMCHSAQIFIFLIKNEHSTMITQSSNPLLTSAQLWLKQMLKFKVSLYGAVLKQRSGLFNIINGTYCCVSYGEQKKETECVKGCENLIKWDQSQFTFSKKHKVQHIQFQIFDKPFMKKDTLVGVARLHGTQVKKGKKQSIEVFYNDKIIGYLEICIQ